MSNSSNMARLGGQINVIDDDATTGFAVMTNNQTITDDYTTEANVNSMIIGPVITITSGKTLTVGTGGALTIL